VTVVIPCFNHGRYLGEAIDSALAQYGGNLPIVVVDDGSTELETETALAGLPESVTVIRQDNAGPAAARNAGFALAQTQYVMPLDADDRLPPGTLTAMRSGLEADPGAAYAYGTMRFFGDWSGVVSFPPFDPYRLLYRPIVGWLGLIRREAWEQVGGFDPSLTGFEDWDFTLATLAHDLHGHRLDRVVLEYRKHGRSGLEGDRRRYRQLYRLLRAKHAELFGRAGQLAAGSDLGPAGRLAYRTWWAWRPLPAAAERALFGLHFRRGR
jgi:glycosyltransferase involved in cell wall biosynthesis